MKIFSFNKYISILTIDWSFLYCLFMSKPFVIQNWIWHWWAVLNISYVSILIWSVLFWSLDETCRECLGLFRLQRKTSQHSLPRSGTGFSGRRIDSILNIELTQSHLSKGPSDLKQKCTQLWIPLLGTIFNAFSIGCINFVRSVSLKNYLLIGWNS